MITTTMPRRKRQRKSSTGRSGQRGSTPAPGVFFRPFAELKKKARVAPKQPAPALPPPPDPTPDPDDSDEAIFARAMADVAPLDGCAAAYRPPPEPSPDQVHPLSEEQEAVLQLGEFVAGAGVFDIVDGDEHVEGLATGLDPRILRRLKRGDYSVAAYLDLHGMVRGEARSALGQFVERSRREGRRCVLVVHGRGLHSKDARPVLKEAVVTWLGRSGLRKQILAFCTARPYDGGAGALYVLLRKA